MALEKAMEETLVRTKIICTIGPAVDDPQVMREMVNSGMDVARMNFSHGTHEEHLKRLKQFRKICTEEGVSIPILMDTKGPEIRLGVFQAPVTLADGQEYVLTTADVVGDDTRSAITYKGLPGDVTAGDHILVDDGLIEMQVKAVTETDIRCQVINGGVLSSKKSVNVPNAALNLPALTDQDRGDMLFAIRHRYDYIAMSFVRKREDVLESARFLAEHGGGEIRLIAKIESREGVENLDEIIRASDGIMVARGDLGVEIPMDEVPIMQKEMIRRCYQAGKPVITATQMLDSMIRNPRPTRAEVTDVANAILDGTSAIMLSGETASGKYPVEALQTMRRIAKTTEGSIDYWKQFQRRDVGKSSSVTRAISHATCTTAMDLNAAAIVAVTTSGGTARRISSFRPSCPIVAVTTSERVFYQLRMSWGVFPFLAQVVGNTDELFAVAVDAAKASGFVSDSSTIVITAGVPVGISGTTNMLKVQTVGHMLCRGKGLGEKQAIGTVCVWKENDKKSFARNCVLVATEITDELLPYIRQSAALVLEEPDRDGKAETLAMALEIPVIVEAPGAMQLLATGSFVSVRAKPGLVECVE